MLIVSTCKTGDDGEAFLNLVVFTHIMATPLGAPWVAIGHEKIREK